MLTSKAFEVELGGRVAWPVCHRPQPYVFHDFPDVPVMPETLLLVELKARERSVDLREISQLVLRDIGASLQIMRRAASESASCEDLPIRIEDCISELGLHTCLDALARKILARSVHQAAFETWKHSRSIAEHCALQVKDTFGTVSPEEAYLVGFFHELGSLPRILGWDRTIMTLNDEETIGLRMAEHWRLPQVVVEYFCELRGPGESQWTKIVRRSHEHAKATSTSSD